MHKYMQSPTSPFWTCNDARDSFLPQEQTPLHREITRNLGYSVY